MPATLQAQFARIAQAAPRLRREFQYLVDTHAAFQSQPAMRGMSVSDVVDDAVEVRFHGLHIRFVMALVNDSIDGARARVICNHCHCIQGKPMQTALGSFTFDVHGHPEVPPDHRGDIASMSTSADLIILMYLQKAMIANAVL